MISPLDSMAMVASEKSMDALWLRSNVISNNIANQDTPGYKVKSVSFESALQSAISGGDVSQVENVTPQVVQENTAIDQNDNGSDMEAQMVNLTRNQLQYNYMIKSVSGNLNLLTIATNEGRG